MGTTPVIEALLARKSIRKHTREQPSDEVVRSIVRAGQQALFAYQMCSVLLSRRGRKKPFGAPLLFTICVDAHKRMAATTNSPTTTTPGPNTSAAKLGSGRPCRREYSASSPGGGFTFRVMGTESEPG